MKMLKWVHCCFALRAVVHCDSWQLCNLLLIVCIVMDAFILSLDLHPVSVIGYTRIVRPNLLPLYQRDPSFR